MEIPNTSNPVVKDISSENDDVIDYGRAGRPKRLAAENGTLIRRLNKQKKIDWLIDCLQIKIGSVKKEPSIFFKEYTLVLF